MNSSNLKNGIINGGREASGRLKSSPFSNQSTFSQNLNSSSNNSSPFNRSNSFKSTNNSFNGNMDKSLNKPFNEIREKGYIEKLLTSYGFVQCSERKGRFFFHYSEFRGNLKTLNIGDLVEFQESKDKRTHKPVAVYIVKLSEGPQGIHPGELNAGELVEGIVISEAKLSKNNNSSGDNSLLMDGVGRVSYEQGGETFFLSYGVDDVEYNHKLMPGDRVTFCISTDERNGNLKARKITKIPSNLPPVSMITSTFKGNLESHQGMVCSMKDNYGFIERADVVKEIFFHFSEFDGDIETLRLGDDVQFGIQIRNNKDVAVNISKLPPGTVVFADVSKEWRRGKIARTLKMACSKKQNDALPGRIVYETLEGPIDISFGEKDPQGDFTMKLGDIVEFCIATDRRDKMEHATNIRLVDDTFSLAREKREKGFVTTLKEGFGFIRCTDREARMFFHFSELLDGEQEVHLQDELEFTVEQDPSNATRLVATRIKVLPSGTIIVPDTFLLEKQQGIVQKEAGNTRPIQCNKDPDPGIIMYEVEGTKQMIPYSSSVVDGNLPKLEEKVEFQISECQKNKTKVAVNVRVLSNRVLLKERGFVVTLKEGFGFIETADHEREIYFHFSNYEGDIDLLEITNEVEFNICNKSGRIAAENIRRIASKTINVGEITTTILEGKILRGIHSADSSEYFGLIQQFNDDFDQNNTNNNSTTSSNNSTNFSSRTTTTATSNTSNALSSSPALRSCSSSSSLINSDNPIVYPFSIMSLVDKRDTLMARGDYVRFQVIEVTMAVNPVLIRSNSISHSSDVATLTWSDGVKKRKWAYKVASIRKFVQARIESLNEHGGSLSYEIENGLKLPFSEKDVQSMSELSLNDEVEFVVSNFNGNKFAVNLRKASDRPRPERLISRIKSVSDDQGPRVVTLRQPRGPDGSSGFKSKRCPIKKESSFFGDGQNEGVTLKGSDLIKGNLNIDRAGGDVVVNGEDVTKGSDGFYEVF